MTLLDRVVDVYAQLLPLLADGGAEWVQFDEPILVTDVPPSTLAAAEHAYERLCGLSDRPKLLVATYFDVLGDALGVLRRTPIDGLALDFTGPAAGNLDLLARAGGLPGRRLIAGVVDGRNVWLNDLEQSSCPPSAPCSGWLARSWLLRPARCCTYHCTWRKKTGSIHRCAVGWPSPSRSWQRPWFSAAASLAAPRRSRAS